MELIRSLLARRHLALLICAATLAIKLLVPGGYMLSTERGHVTIEICSGVAGKTMSMVMPGAMPGMMDHGQSKGQHGGVEMPCAFAGLSHQALGTVDPVLVVAAIAFIVARGVAPSPRRPIARVAYLRPPLRGPPVTF